MPCRATKPILPRVASDKMCTVSQKVKANMAIAANYGNKHMKCPIIIEDSSDNNLEKLVQKRKLPPEPGFIISWSSCNSRISFQAELFPCASKLPPDINAEICKDVGAYMDID